ncbi:MAG: MBL fold metallo-hydrolase [Oscillospiraceae bacterium]
MSEIKVTYYGHSCFKVEAEGYSIIFDPYEDGYVPGLKPLRVQANEVLCSHSHADHDFREGVEIIPGGNKPFTLETIICPHDDDYGSLRGMNIIHVLHFKNQKIAHMGDVGDMLPEEDIEKLRGADILMIPVGGYYTIDAAAANKLVRAIKPRVTIPMHFRTDTSGFQVLARCDDFIALCDNVEKHGFTFTVDDHTPERTILMAQKNAN